MSGHGDTRLTRTAVPKRGNRARGTTRLTPRGRLAACTRELEAALQQQSATSEILHVISNSPRNLQAALETIAGTAARLLHVKDAEIMRVEGDALRLVAKYGPMRQFWPLGDLRTINRNWVTGRAVVDRATIHIPDLTTETADFPEGAAYAKQYGHRTTLAAPLLRKNQLFPS